MRILCNDGLIGTGHLLGHTGLAETIPEQPGVPTRHNKDVGLLVAEFDRGEKVTSTGTVESANRGKDRMGRARLKGCRATAGERR